MVPSLITAVLKNALRGKRWGICLLLSCCGSLALAQQHQDSQRYVPSCLNSASRGSKVSAPIREPIWPPAPA